MVKRRAGLIVALYGIYVLCRDNDYMLYGSTSFKAQFLAH